MAAWFVLTIPTAAYEQQLLADRDQNADGNKELSTSQVNGFKGILSLGPIKESTLLQNRSQETGLNSSKASTEPGCKTTTNTYVRNTFHNRFLSLIIRQSR